MLIGGDTGHAFSLIASYVRFGVPRHALGEYGKASGAGCQAVAWAIPKDPNAVVEHPGMFRFRHLTVLAE